MYAACCQGLSSAHLGSRLCAPPAPPAPNPPQTAPPASADACLAGEAHNKPCGSRHEKAALHRLASAARHTQTGGGIFTSGAGCFSKRTSLEPCRLQVLLTHTCSVCLTGRFLPLAEQVVGHGPACVRVLTAAGSARYVPGLCSCFSMLLVAQTKQPAPLALVCWMNRIQLFASCKQTRLEGQPLVSPQVIQLQHGHSFWFQHKRNLRGEVHFGTKLSGWVDNAVWARELRFRHSGWSSFAKSKAAGQAVSSP